MTAIRDALTKAGIDTAGAELRAAALNALNANSGDVKKAALQIGALMIKRRDLLAALALGYLRGIAGEPAPATALAAEEKPLDVKVGKHLRHRPRTAVERDSALRIAGRETDILANVFDRRVNGRPIGDVLWGELTKMVRNNADDAANFLQLGHEFTLNAILLRKIKSFASVDDHATPVRRVISAAQLQTFLDEAQAETPHFVEAGVRQYARNVTEKTVKEIAA